jgi:hypothetical protein
MSVKNSINGPIHPEDKTIEDAVNSLTFRLSLLGSRFPCRNFLVVYLDSEIVCAVHIQVTIPGLRSFPVVLLPMPFQKEPNICIFVEENMDICGRFRRVLLIIPFSNVGKLRHRHQSILGLPRRREICPKRAARRTHGIE